MNEPLSFGHRLKQLRRAQDLTQAMLARGVGCAEITIQKIEAGALRPSRQIAERLAEVFALPAEDRLLFIQLARGQPSAANLASHSSHPLLNIGALQVRDLPIPPTPLIGREQETAAVCAILLRREVRLLTLIGPPGVGKTRLALRVAEQLGEHFADGIVFISLAPFDDLNQVMPAIAHSLGVPEHADQSVEEQLKSVLHGRNLLLLLDNFEHLAPAAPQLARLLGGADKFKLLVTSRVVLHVSGEHVYGLAPLPTPDPAADQAPAALAKQPAVALFVARAGAVKPSFRLTAANAQAVAAICARLDGLPLAIELAAARSNLFAPPTLLKRLEQRLSLLTGGAHDLPARQQTLRGAIDWSYQLLNGREKALLARLAVFASGCTLAAVEAVCSDQASDSLDLLAMLLDKSLVQQNDDGHGDPRFILLDTVREYALERLAARSELDAMRRRHATYLMALAEQAEPAFEGAEREQQPAWLLHLDKEQDNLRAALHWCYTKPEGTEIGLRITAAIWQFWWIRGYLTEGRQWVAQALAHALAATRLRAKLLNQAGFLAASQGDYTTACRCHEGSLALADALDDKQALADGYIGLANIAVRQSDYQRAGQLFAQSATLFQELGDTSSLAWSLAGLATVARIWGDYTQTYTLLEESRTMFHSIGYKRGLAYVLYDLGLLAQDEEDFLKAESLYMQSLAMLDELGERHAIADVLTALSFAALYQDNYERASIHYRKSLSLCRDLADNAGIIGNFMGLASTIAAQGRPCQAARLWGVAEALRETIGMSLLPVEQAVYQRAVAAARASCDARLFEAEWLAGRCLTIEQALAEMLCDSC